MSSDDFNPAKAIAGTGLGRVAQAIVASVSRDGSLNGSDLARSLGVSATAVNRAARDLIERCILIDLGGGRLDLSRDPADYAPRPVGRPRGRRADR